ncbi:hypothetical protein H4Q26_007969 [Puccinia striiformis f. sp. tritici PST-130]|nr:hypothetical protein H4Q26_007969 [Puccinia striiformis f. sp. tritici PST-130]
MVKISRLRVHSRSSIPQRSQKLFFTRPLGCFFVIILCIEWKGRQDPEQHPEKRAVEALQLEELDRPRHENLIQKTYRTRCLYK